MSAPEKVVVGDGTAAPARQRHSMSFSRVAAAVSHAIGSPHAFVAAASTIVIWAVSGPYFGYSDFWQLSVNTGTTIVTFLVVFLIQNSQNRDTTEIKTMLRQIAVDLPEVNTRRAFRDQAEET